MELDNRQKKIITIIAIVLLSAIFFAGLAVGIYFISVDDIKVGAIITAITNFVSPTTIVGIVIKIFISKYFNKKNKKDVETILKDHGLEKKKKKHEHKIDDNTSNMGYII